jgi:hypothetical protein
MDVMKTFVFLTFPAWYVFVLGDVLGVSCDRVGPKYTSPASPRFRPCSIS